MLICGYYFCNCTHLCYKQNSRESKAKLCKWSYRNFSRQMCVHCTNPAYLCKTTKGCCSFLSAYMQVKYTTSNKLCGLIAVESPGWTNSFLIWTVLLPCRTSILVVVKAFLSMDGYSPKHNCWKLVNGLVQLKPWIWLQGHLCKVWSVKTPGIWIHTCRLNMTSHNA